MSGRREKTRRGQRRPAEVPPLYASGRKAEREKAEAERRERERERCERERRASVITFCRSSPGFPLLH